MKSLEYRFDIQKLLSHYFHMKNINFPGGMNIAMLALELKKN